MTDEAPSIIAHLSVPVSDVARARAFYGPVLKTVGAQEIMSHGDDVVAYGKQFPEFWVHRPYEGEPATGNGWHVAFLAASREQVEDFYAAALKSGATDDGPPGPRPDYGPAYFGCFVRDLDGNKIEAMFWDFAKG